MCCDQLLCNNHFIQFLGRCGACAIARRIDKMASPGTASTSSRPDQQETPETANPTTTPPVKKRRIQTDKTASPGSMSSTSSSRLETSPRYARTKIPRTRERSGGASELEHQKFVSVHSVSVLHFFSARGPPSLSERESMLGLTACWQACLGSCWSH